MPLDIQTNILLFVSFTFQPMHSTAFFMCTVLLLLYPNLIYLLEWWDKKNKDEDTSWNYL